MRDTYQDLLLPERLEKGFKDTAQTWENIKENLECKTVIDIGCNQGYCMSQCLRGGAKMVLGVDLNGTHWCAPIGELEKPLDVARRSIDEWGFENVELIEGDWENIVINEKIDVVLCLSTSHYFKNVANGLKKMFEMKPELLIFEANPFVFDHLKRIAKEYHYRIVEKKESHWNGYTIFKFRL